LAGRGDRRLSVADSCQARETEGKVDEMGLGMTQFTAAGNVVRPGGFLAVRVRFLELARAAYDQAIALDSGSAVAHSNRGTALRDLGRTEDALAAYDQAIALDPGSAAAHENKGIFLAATGSLKEALAELDAAQHLAPNGAGEGATWAGAIMWHQQDAAGARERFRSVAGRVTGCTPFRTAEMEAIALCGLGQPDAAKQHLLATVPRRVPGNRSEPRAIYGLMSDPPLPGIERLREIAEGTA
jgi:tetratricopeptide (TPR) repeat protein